MTSALMTRVTAFKSPEDILLSVFNTIVHRERMVELSPKAKKYFVKQYKRVWGLSVSSDEIEYVVDGANFIVTLGVREYSRSCYMGTTTYSMTIPDAVVQAYEAYESDDSSTAEDMARYSGAVDALNKERADKIEAEAEQKELDEQAEAEAKKAKQDSDDLAKFKELQARFEPNA